jgi:prevent-host-death family protein
MENTMNLVNVTDLRQHLPEYLKQVQQGEEIVITLHGKSIARIVPNFSDNKREQALKRLDTLRGKMILGDILSPLNNDEWTGDANHL